MTPGSWLRARRGLLLGLGLALLLTGAAHLAVEAFLDHERRQAEAAAFVEAGRDAQAARLTLLRTLDAVDTLVQLMRERQVLAERGNKEGMAGLEALARNVVARRAFGVLQVAMIGPDGRVTWSSVAGWTPVDLSDRPHFRAHRPGPDGAAPADALFVSEPVLGRVSGTVTVQATRPVPTTTGQFGGVAVISLDPVDLARLLRELLSDENGVISVFRADSTLLSRSHDPATSIGRRLKPDSPTLRLIRAGQEGDVRTNGSIAGREILVALRRVPDTVLYVTAHIDVIAVQAATRQVTTLLRAGEVAFALLAFGAIGLHHQRRQRRRDQVELAAVEEVRRETAMVLEGLPGAAYRAELDAQDRFRFLYGSPTITELTGMRRSELAGVADWQARCEAVDPPQGLQALVAAARHGPQSFDMLFRRPDGARRWLRTSVQPLRRHADGRCELVGFTSDVTEHREALSAMVNSAKLATLGEMATGLAHELNQPVSIMALAAENTARGLRRHGGAAIPDALLRMDRIGALAQRAKAIIDHLRAFGRTDPGPLEAVAVEEAVAGAAMLAGAALREAEVTLVLDLPAGLPPVRGQLLLLEQVLINLLLNARDALLEIPPAARRIAVSARLVDQAAPGGGPAERRMAVTIADSGPGIPPAVLPRLFEPFFTTKPTGQGTGLGLSLCHGIMRSLGGMIGAANGPAGGAEFRLLLQPAAAAPASPGALVSAPPLPGALAADAAEP
ncbi:ATP-binding protein [Dankookia sp. GCM10030260]|uniref:ATP-binding protein n=1 Tax=Dankookia sp. GCM10030260 TaxID=3273390 RepID=UPI003606D487